MKSLSVIVVTKNNDDELEKTIDSIAVLLSQDIEVIVVNGSDKVISKDFSKYKEHSFRILEGPDDGIYNGMNRGANCASGKYLWFLNSGDYCINLDLLEALLYIMKIEQPDLVLALQKPYLRFASTQLKFQENLLISGVRPVAHQSSIFSSSLFNLLGQFNEEYEVFADQAFFYKMFTQDLSIIKIDQALTLRTPGGIGDLQKYGIFFGQIKSLRLMNRLNPTVMQKTLVFLAWMLVSIRKIWKK
jgi:glycosyltransferase involved in cell wall biosynthesis